MMRDDFAVFILTHGRADNVKTLKTLKRAGYTGKWYMVIDNEDDQEPQYRKNFGDDRVIVFDKLEMSKRFDTADTSDDRRTIVYARNACFDIAEQIGVKYFLEFDDDYTSIDHRYIEGDKFKYKRIADFDRVCCMMIDFLDQSKALTVAFAQGGDFIGGAKSSRFKEGILRKAMNSFFCTTDRRFDFVGRINEDVNTYTVLGQRGEKIFSITDIDIVQTQTQLGNGGMTGVYLDGGTYLKSFYTIMFSPSCVKISVMGDKHMRIHHKVQWNFCCPKILGEKWKKQRSGGS